MRFGSFEEMLSFYAVDSRAVALIHGENGEKEEITYSLLVKLIDKKAAEIKNSGKTSIGIICSSSVECIVTVFAAVKAGLQVVLIDGGLHESVKKAQIKAADVDMLYSDDKEETVSLSSALTGGVEKDAGRILFFTSGTTSSSKAVVLTEKSLCSSAYNGSAKLPLTKDDTLLCLLPISHVFGFVCSLLWGLSCGAKIALSRGMRFVTEDFNFFNPTAVSLVPMLLGFFIKNRLFNDSLSLILIGAGDCPDALLEAAKAMGKRVSFGYGLTETSSGVAISVEGNPRAMEICPDDEIFISGDGEILIKAPTCLMQGYYKDEKATEEAVKDGILYSGDLGFIDMDGKLHITGRKKEMLVLPSGTKIFLPDYEAAISKAIENTELAVILLKNKPVLVVKEIEEKRREIQEKINEEMKKHPRSHQLSQVIFTDKPLPRTATGKIKRWEIQKTEEEKNGKNDQG
ncbi:MAG: acyl--CoA ligase [Ruminococcaceae bacterium]|jgi:long-subunit acyl-CoA synthetase (AMP-forming)|nr:acyl--CoA ligase [Oscillospiraceae bacterium]